MGQICAHRREEEDPSGQKARGVVVMAGAGPLLLGGAGRDRGRRDPNWADHSSWLFLCNRYATLYSLPQVMQLDTSYCSCRCGGSLSLGCDCMEVCTHRCGECVLKGGQKNISGGVKKMGSGEVLM